MANGFGPRIQNISADELRRLFQAPEIQKPGLTVSDAINLTNALEQRRKNQLEERRKIAEIERKIAEEEQKAQDVQTLATARGQQAMQGAEAQARENIDPTQPGPEIGPLTAEDQAAIEQAKGVAEAKFRLEPSPDLAQERTLARDVSQSELKEQQEQRNFERDKELLGIKFANKMKELAFKEKQKSASAKTKASGLVQRLVAQGDNLSSMIDEFKTFDRLLNQEGFKGVKGVSKGKIAVPLDKLTGGAAQLLTKGTFLGDFLSVNPEISTQDELADSLARRIYKTISGDVGNIAFSEGAFAKAFVPRAGETPDRRKAKIDRLQRFANRLESGAESLRIKFNAGQIREEDLPTEIGNIANEAFTAQAKALGLTPQELEEEQTQGNLQDLGDGFSFEEVPQ